MPVEQAFYHLYGVPIAADLELPIPQRLPTRPVEIAIRRTRITHDLSRCVDEGLIQYELSGLNWLLHYRDTGSFCIQGTHTLLVDPFPQATASQVHQRLLGSVLGLLLRRRGLLVLHANVLWRDGGAILLLGDSGAGKSTLSGALCQHEYRLCSDDLGVIKLSHDGGLVMPGPAQLKLRPDSAATLAMPGRWDVGAGKYVHTLEAATPVESIPIRAIYVLEPGLEITLNILPVREALLALIQHAHLPRSLDVTRCSAQHFLQAAWIARQVPMYRLVRGTTLSMLEEVVATVEKR